MSGVEELVSEEMINAEEGDGEGGEGMEEYADADDPDLASMERDLAKAEQEKDELEKLKKLQDGPAAAAANAAEKAGTLFCTKLKILST